MTFTNSYRSSCASLLLEEFVPETDCDSLLKFRLDTHCWEDPCRQVLGVKKKKKRIPGSCVAVHRNPRNCHGNRFTWDSLRSRLSVTQYLLIHDFSIVVFHIPLLS